MPVAICAYAQEMWLETSCSGETRMQTKDGKCKDISSVKLSHDSQVVKEINSEIVSGAL